MKTEASFDVIFQHLIDLPQNQCVFASTRERYSGKRLLFLFEHDRERVFKRNSMNDTWDELNEEQGARDLRENFLEQLRLRQIPCYQAAGLDVFHAFA